MSAASLNWAGAEVHEGKLAVEVQGEVPSGWRKSFQTTVRLLGGGESGKVDLKKRTVQVTGVVPGSEEKLRHFLESAIEQANTTHPPKEPDSEEPEGGEASDDDRPDAVMTRRFRSFADPRGRAA